MSTKTLILAGLVAMTTGAFAAPHHHHPAPIPVHHHHHHDRDKHLGAAVVGGLVGGVIGGVIAAERPAPPPPVVVTPAPVVVTPAPVVVAPPPPPPPRTVVQQVWVDGRYVDQIQPNGTVIRVWQPGHYEQRTVIVP